MPSVPPNPPSQTGDELQAALDKVEREFIDLWRGMSSLWGMSPTMAQIHGLLFLSGEVLSTDNIMARLHTSRGNVSMNLTRLVEWGLVRRVHRPRDRRDYFEAVGDVWEIFTAFAKQRKRREIDPMLNSLRQCGEQLSPAHLGAQAGDERVAGWRHRIADLLAFLMMCDNLAQRLFESHQSLRTALELMAHKEARDNSPE